MIGLHLNDGATSPRTWSELIGIGFGNFFWWLYKLIKEGESNSKPQVYESIFLIN